MKATLSDDRPMPPPMYRARVANAPPPQPARDGPPWHLALAPCPMRRPRCQPVLPRPQRATACRRGRAAQPRPKVHSAAAHPASICPSSARAHPHACWNAAGCAIQAAAWIAELCTSEPTLVPQSRADTPSTSNRRYHIPHTRQRSERTNDIAHAPFWRKSKLHM